MTDVLEDLVRRKVLEVDPTSGRGSCARAYRFNPNVAAWDVRWRTSKIEVLLRLEALSRPQSGDKPQFARRRGGAQTDFARRRGGAQILASAPSRRRATTAFARRRGGAQMARFPLSLEGGFPLAGDGQQALAKKERESLIEQVKEAVRARAGQVVCGRPDAALCKPIDTYGIAHVLGVIHRAPTGAY